MKKLALLLFLLLLHFCAFAQSRSVSETTKKIVYARDGGICKCCGSTLNIEYDHITPFSCGGGNEAANIQLLCQKCNRSKSNSCYCKLHNRKVGTNCCDGATTTQKKSPARQCSGITKKGAGCKNRTTNANGRCHLHQ
jgi:5-methylcytosine-specific restriction endonuclease McrA